jgi:hypothetical protein
LAGTTTENVAKVREAILEDRTGTIHDVRDIVIVAHGTCQKILLQDLNMPRIAMKFVPRLPSNDQKEHCVAVCSELKEQTENDPNFISTIITDDESWVYGFNPETKQQSSKWKMPDSPQPKKVRQVRNNVKSMLICFF